MSTLDEATAQIKTPAEEISLDIGATARHRRRLKFCLRNNLLTLALLPPQKRGRYSHVSLTFTTAWIRDCRIMFDKGEDADATLIVNGTHYDVTAKDARIIVEKFGMYSWVNKE